MGQQVRYRLPNTMQEAIQIANTVASADRQQQDTSWGHGKRNNADGHVFVTSVTCYHCNKVGHLAKNCFKKLSRAASGKTQPHSARSTSYNENRNNKQVINLIP